MWGLTIHPVLASTLPDVDIVRFDSLRDIVSLTILKRVY